METLKPIEDHKKTIAGMVQERIRVAILDGMLVAGSRLDQNKLAADLSVSLVPIREALKKLEAEGFVQIIPRRGAFVTKTSADDMQELYFARQIMEGQAAYHAAEKLSDDNLTELSKLMGEMTQQLETHDYVAFMHSNRRFHFIIYEAADNRYLLNAISALWDLAERYRFRYVFFRDQGPIIQAEHQAIMDACYARDKGQLRDAIAYHMGQTLDGVQSYLKAQHGNSIP